MDVFVEWILNIPIILNSLTRDSIGTPRDSAEVFRILSRNTSPASHDREPHPFGIGKMTDTINTDHAKLSVRVFYIRSRLCIARRNSLSPNRPRTAQHGRTSNETACREAMKHQ